MKKLILKMFVVVLALAAFNTLMSCSSKDDEDSIAGTWGISSDAVMNGSNWGRARSYAGYEPEYFIYHLNSAVFFLVRKFYMLRCLLGFYMLI